MYNSKQIAILNALYFIKSVCLDNVKCDDCPLYLNNVCIIIHYTPDHWNMSTAEEPWRAFKGADDEVR